MKAAFLIFLLLLSLGSVSRAQTVECNIQSTSWDQLLNSFVENWKNPQDDLCEFKRLILLNSMLTKDMRLDATEYEIRLKTLERFDVNSDAGNYLKLAFQETWFKHFMDLALENETQKTMTLKQRMGGALSIAVLGALALRNTRKVSSKTLGIFRTLIDGFFSSQKREFAFGSAAILRANGKSGKEAAADQLELVRPPLFDKTDESNDSRVNGIFKQELYEELTAATVGITAGWVSGHTSSLYVKRFLPKWNSIPALSRYSWIRTRPIDYFSPGLLAGLGITLIATDFASKIVSDVEFKRAFEKKQAELGETTARLQTAVTASDDYQIWLNAEKLENELTLDNYLLTRKFSDGFEDEAQNEFDTIRNRQRFCGLSLDTVLKEEAPLFKEHVAKIIREKSFEINAALKLSQNVQLELFKMHSRLLSQLKSTNEMLMEKLASFTDAESLTSETWSEITTAALKSPAVDCIDYADDLGRQ